MLTHPTHDRLPALGLTGIASALEEQRRSPAFDVLSFEERLGLLIDREAAERDGKKLASRLKFAALRQDASVEDLDLRTPRGIDRSVMAHLADGGWIARHENLLIRCLAGDACIAEKDRPHWFGQKLDRLALLGTRLAETEGPSSINAPRACSRPLLWPAEMAATNVSSKPSHAWIC